MDTQIATAQRWAEACELLFSLTSTHWMADDKHNCAGDIQKLLEYRQQARREALEEAVKVAREPYSDAVEAYGSDEPSIVGQKIANAIDRLREGVEG